MILNQPQESVSTLYELILTQPQGFGSVSISLAVRVSSGKAACLCKIQGWLSWHWLERCHGWDGAEHPDHTLIFEGIEITN